MQLKGGANAEKKIGKNSRILKEWFPIFLFIFIFYIRVNIRFFPSEVVRIRVVLSEIL